MKTFPVVICLLLVTGCGVEVRDPSSTPVRPQLTQEAFNKIEVTVRAEALNNPNQYQVHFLWTPFEGAVKIFEDATLKKDVAATEGHFLDLDVRAGSTVEYTFDLASTDNQFKKQQKVVVVIPHDLVIEDQVVLTQNTSWEAARIFFKPKMRVLTQNYNLTLKADKLISDGGLIQNFGEEMQADVGNQGRSGGVIFIIAREAHGTLKVLLNGEDGGSPSRTRLPAGPGGLPGVFRIQVQEHNNLRLQLREQEGSWGGYSEKLLGE